MEQRACLQLVQGLYSQNILRLKVPNLFIQEQLLKKLVMPVIIYTPKFFVQEYFTECLSAETSS